MYADEAEETLVFPWLLDEVAGPALDALDGQVDVAPGRHHDHRESRIHLLDARQQVEALLPRGGVAGVIQVNQQDIIVTLAQRFQNQLRRAHTLHLHGLRLEQKLYGLEFFGFIVRDPASVYTLSIRDALPT